MNNQLQATSIVLFYLLLIFLLINPLFAYNNLGTPFITHYSKDQYQAGTQTWDIKQNLNGILYFANNDGLLEFDGTNWRTYQLANRTIARSLAIDENGRIYVGAQGEFGYFEGNNTGILVYHSLLEKIPKDLSEFDDVWDTEIKDGRIFFRSAGKIYSFHDSVFKHYDLKEEVEHLSKCNGEIYAVGKKSGLFVFKDGDFKIMPGTRSLTGYKVTAILHQEDQSFLITTLKNGIYQYKSQLITPWVTSVGNFLKNNRIYSGINLSGNRVALGTSLSGLIILDKKGRPTYHFSKKNGLQNNNILTLQADNKGNVWAGLNIGIDYLEISSPYSIIYPDGDLEGTTYASVIHKGKIYLGTSSGLYVTDWTSYYDPFSTKRFELVKGTDGQVWNLFRHDDKLLLGHHEGTFLIKGDKATNISTVNGAWAFVSLDDHPGYIIGGTYSGLTLFQVTDSGVKFVKKFDDFAESSRIMALDSNGDLWVTHPYRGAFKIKLASNLDHIETVSFYNSDHGFPSDLDIHVFKIGEELFFTAEKSVYRYSPESNQFIREESYNSIFGDNARVKRLIPDDRNNVWYVVDEKVGFLDIKRNGLENDIINYEFPKLFNELVGGFEHIYPYENNDVFFGTEKGFIYYNQDKKVKMISPTALIREVRLSTFKDSILFSGELTKKVKLQKRRLHNSLNALQFSFSAPDFSNIVEYSYRLEGLDNNWSGWSTKTEKEYTNLNPGDYQFSVRARHSNQAEGPSASFDFSISSPWYKTTFAYLVYLLIIGFMGYRWIRKTQKKFEKEKEVLLTTQEEILEQKDREHRQVVENSEREIIELKNDKLEIEINHQNEELASLTMHFVQKNEMIHKLKEELVSLGSKSNEPDTRRDIKRLIRLLDSDARMDEDWPRFAYYFNRVHRDFTKKVVAIHPELTQKDLKLCVFLRMNLSTKEIAPLLNISVRGVEIGRYRLRKKLGLESKVRLGDYLQGI